MDAYQVFFRVSRSVHMGWKKNFPDSKQGEEKTSLLRQETLLTQLADFLRVRESRPQARGPVCFYGFIPQGEERSGDTPADLPIGWGRRGLTIHLLVGGGV